jgi:hypothetical protein
MEEMKKTLLIEDGINKEDTIQRGKKTRNWRRILKII